MDLVNRAQRGEEHALSELIGRYSPRVRKFVRHKLGAKLRQRLESVDIVQSTFAQAALRFETFEQRGDNSLMNYLCKIAENKIREQIRFHWAKRRSPDREVAMQDEDGKRPSTTAKHDETPSQVFARSDVSQTVRDCIKALPENCRESIMLCCFGDLSFAEIAAITNRPTSDAARMFHRDTAIKALAEELRKRGVTGVDLL